MAKGERSEHDPSRKVDRDSHNERNIEWSPHSISVHGPGTSASELPTSPAKEAKNKHGIQKRSKLLTDNGFQPHSETDTHITHYNPSWGQYSEIDKSNASYRMSKPTKM
jgi:hypothetical protein